MAYRIEITAETLSELAGKTLALAAQFQATVADPVMPEVKAATRKTKATKADAPTASNEANEAPEADVGNETQTSQSEPASSGPTEASQTAAEKPEAASEPELDAVRDVQPLVLKAVAKLSKERTSQIVRSYGAERVTQLDPSTFPALIAELKVALGE